MKRATARRPRQPPRDRWPRGSIQKRLIVFEPLSPATSGEIVKTIRKLNDEERKKAPAKPPEGARKGGREGTP